MQVSITVHPQIIRQPDLKTALSLPVKIAALNIVQNRVRNLYILSFTTVFL